MAAQQSHNHLGQTILIQPRMLEKPLQATIVGSKLGVGVKMASNMGQIDGPRADATNNKRCKSCKTGLAQIKMRR